MNKGYIYLILAALSYASMGALVRVLGVSLPPFTQLFLRLLFSALLTFLLVAHNKSGFKLKKKVDYLYILPMGVIGYGLELSFYTLSFYHTTIANALFIFSSYPILAAIFAYIFLKERVGKRLLIALVILSISLILIFNPNDIAKGILGNIYAFLNATCFAIYVIFSRLLSKHGNKSETITLWTVVLAIATSGAGVLTFEHLNLHISLNTSVVIVIFGFLNFLGYNLINKGFATVNAGIGTLLLSLEAVFGSVIGLIFFHEVPSLVFLIGAFQVLLSIYIASFRLD